MPIYIYIYIFFHERPIYENTINVFLYAGLATLATLFLALLSVLQYRYDSFVAIHRPKRTRRIILLQSITDTLLSMLWLATFLEMLLMSRVKPLYATDVTSATTLSWYFANGFAGISWYVMSETLLVVQSSWKCLYDWVLDRLLFLYTAWLLASSIYMFRKTRMGREINIFVSSRQTN